MEHTPTSTLFLYRGPFANLCVADKTIAQAAMHYYGSILDVARFTPRLQMRSLRITAQAEPTHFPPFTSAEQLPLMLTTFEDNLRQSFHDF